MGLLSWINVAKIVGVIAIAFTAIFSIHRAGRIAERMKTMEENEQVRRRMNDAVKNSPRSRDAISKWLRDGNL